MFEEGMYSSSENIPSSNYHKRHLQNKDEVRSTRGEHAYYINRTKPVLKKNKDQNE
jgi:hypothetical protein